MGGGGRGAIHLSVLFVNWEFRLNIGENNVFAIPNIKSAGRKVKYQKILKFMNAERTERLFNHQCQNIENIHGFLFFRFVMRIKTRLAN